MKAKIKGNEKQIKVQKREIKKQLKAINAEENIKKKYKSKVRSTLTWLDLKDVKDDCMVINNGDIVKGIRILPHNIFIDDPQAQEMRINDLRLAYNRFNFKIYHSFITTRLNSDAYNTRLLQLSSHSDDPVIRSIVDSDYNKMSDFVRNYEELQFFLMIREKDERIADKYLEDLYSEFRRCGFKPQVLNKQDYLNYIAYVFENPTVNSFYFSQGIFKPMSDNYYLTEDGHLSTIPLQDGYKYDENLSSVDFIRSTNDIKMKKSRWAPTSFKAVDDYMYIGDKYCSIITTVNLPAKFVLGELCQYLNNHEIKVFMTTERFAYNLDTMIKKDYNDKLNALQKAANDPVLQTRLRQELFDNQSYLDHITRNNDATFNVVLSFLICCDTKSRLDELRTHVSRTLRAAGYNINSCRCMQEEALSMILPILNDRSLPSEVRNNFGLPLPSEGIAGLYPYIFDYLKDPKGFLLGCEMDNKGIIQFDQFFYINNGSDVSSTQRLNGNMVIVGKAGSGKTVSLDLLMRDHVKCGYNIIVIDPENKIQRLIRSWNGTCLNYGQRGNIINPFDLRPISSDDDTITDQRIIEAEKWDTEVAIQRAISDVVAIVDFLSEDFNDEERSVLGNIIVSAYAHVGFKKDPVTGKYPPFKNFPKDKYPTFSDINNYINVLMDRVRNDASQNLTLEALSHLSFKIDRICNEYGTYLDGHTTLKYEEDGRKIIYFGTKQLQNVGEGLKDALNYIIYNYAWSLCIDNEDKAAFIIDEAHVNILSGEVAKLTAQFARRSRKYKTCLIVATQEPKDFSASEEVLIHGKAIFNNSAYKLIMNLDLDAMKDVSKLVDLNPNEQYMIQRFGRGQGLFVVGNRRIPINVLASKEELEAIGGLS